MPSLSLSLLGPFQAVLNGRPVTGLESNKVRALLTFLAVEADQPHARDELIGLLWPDQPDTAARANLRQALILHFHSFKDEEAIPNLDRLSFCHLASDHHAWHW